jgi:hypothetical protein
MNGLSIWHWGIIIVWLGLLLIPIVSADPNKTLPRKGYVFRSIGFIALITIGSIISNALPGPVDSALLLVAALIGATLIYLWSVHRTQDIGWSRWWNLLFLMPVISLGWWIILMARPTRRAI